MDDSINIYRSQMVANAFHFFVAAAKASLYPFLTLYFRYLGLSAFQTGIVIGVKAFLSMCSAPIWLACASKCNRMRCVLMTSIFIVMLSSLMLSLVPSDNPKIQDFCVTPKPLNDDINGPQAVNGTSYNGTVSDTQIMLNVNTTSIPSQGAHATESIVNTTLKSLTTTNIPSISSSTSFSSSTMQSSTLSPTTRTTTSYPEEERVDLLKVMNSLSPEELSKFGLTEDDLQQMKGYSMEEILSFLEDHVVMSSNSPVTTQGDEDIGSHESGDGNYFTDEERETLINAGIPPEIIDNIDSTRLSKYLQNVLDDGQSRKKRNALSSGMESLNDKLSIFQEKLAKIENVSFILVLSIVIFGELFSCSIEKLSDRLWFDFIDGIDMLEKYGTQKSWSIVAWMLMPVTVGYLFDKTDCHIFDTVYHFNIHFYVFAALMGFGFIFSFVFPVLREKRRVQRHISTWKGLKVLCGDIHGFTYCVCIFILGAASAGIDNFLFWQVQDLGGSEVIMGGAVSIGALTSLVMHILTRWVVYKISNAGAVVIAFSALVIRLVVYAYISSPYAVLAIGFLHGFSHTLMLGALETYPDFKVNPYIMDRSAKATLNCLHMGIAYAFGSVLSGFIYDNFDLQYFYLGAAIVSVAWCLVFALVHKCARRSKKVRYARLLQAEEDQLTSDSEDEDDWLQSALKHEK